MKELVLENPHRRSSTKRKRYSSRRGGRHKYKFSGFSVMRNPMSLGGVVTKETLTLGGGALIATILSNFVVGRWGAKLPGIQNGFGRVAYNILIPVAGAYLVKRFANSPRLAQGMVIGGLANGIGQLVTSTNLLPVSAAPALPAAVQANLPAPAAQAEYLGEYFDNSNDGGVAAAFSTDAWA